VQQVALCLELLQALQCRRKKRRLALLLVRLALFCCRLSPRLCEKAPDTLRTPLKGALLRLVLINYSGKLLEKRLTHCGKQWPHNRIFPQVA
jgi:hypothetical protein